MWNAAAATFIINSIFGPNEERTCVHVYIHVFTSKRYEAIFYVWPFTSLATRRLSAASRPAHIVASLALEGSKWQHTYVLVHVYGAAHMCNRCVISAPRPHRRCQHIRSPTCATEDCFTEAVQLCLHQTRSFSVTSISELRSGNQTWTVF